MEYHTDRKRVAKIPCTALILLIIATGCVSYTGPVTGKKYNHHILDLNQVALHSYYREVRVNSYLKANPSTSEEVKNDLVNGKVAIGMKKDQVIAAWGKPDDINRTVWEHGTHEQWVYGSHQYLYFEDGFLTSFQD